jgi:ankyrin repeat protein
MERIEAVKILIYRNAQISLKNKFGLNCLHIAAKQGNIEMLDIILLKVIDDNLLNDVDNCLMSALHYAVKGGFFFITCSLLEKKVDVKIINQVFFYYYSVDMLN